tara:strand:+ start:104 stop:334 length:231 start_codon:yes stop_codon:yes gene_type:complete
MSEQEERVRYCTCDLSVISTSPQLPSWCSNCGERLSEEQLTEYYDVAQMVSIDLIKEHNTATDDDEIEVEKAEVGE